jgi:hypothetical protein
LSNEASQQQPVFIVTYPAKSSISVPVGVSSNDFIKKEIETYLLSYLTPEDNKFINQQDIVFQMLTREFTCDIGKVRFYWLFYFL